MTLPPQIVALAAVALLEFVVALLGSFPWWRVRAWFESRAERRRKIHTLALYPDYKDSEPDA